MATIESLGNLVATEAASTTASGEHLEHQSKFAIKAGLAQMLKVDGR